MSSSNVLRLTLRLSSISQQLTSLTFTQAAPAVTQQLTSILPVHSYHRCFFSSTTTRNQDTTTTQIKESSKQSTGSGGGISSWVKSKIPFALGGNREEISKLENLSIDDFAEGLKQARRMGALTGFASGTSAASDPAAQGTLRLFENIIAAMTEKEKQEAMGIQFSSSSRERISTEVGCSVMQVDDCVARYRWMRSMSVKMAQLKKEGKPMPKSIDELEAILGTWRQHKQLSGTTNSPNSGSSTITSSSGGGIEVPMDAMSLKNKNQPCALAGQNVGKNTKCPLTKKSYKACCGRR